jgi:hypothetical protein
MESSRPVMSHKVLIFNAGDVTADNSRDANKSRLPAITHSSDTVHVLYSTVQYTVQRKSAAKGIQPNVAFQFFSKEP